MLYFTCTMKSSVDLAHYGLSRAKDWVSLDCGRSAFTVNAIIPVMRARNIYTRQKKKRKEKKKKRIQKVFLLFGVRSNISSIASIQFFSSSSTSICPKIHLIQSQSESVNQS